MHRQSRLIGFLCLFVGVPATVFFAVRDHESLTSPGMVFFIAYVVLIGVMLIFSRDGKQPAPTSQPNQAAIVGDDTKSVNQSQSSGLDKLSITVTWEIVVRVLSGFVIALYLLGYVVTASTLSRYGLSPVTPLSLQYLVAGGWFVASLVPALTLFVLAGIAGVIDEAASYGSSKESIRNAQKLVLAGVLTVFVLWGLICHWLGVFSVGSILSAFKHWPVYETLALSFISFVAIVVCAAVWFDVPDMLAPPIKRPRVLGLVLTHICAATVVIMYAAFFGSQIYSHIPKGLGGSRALTITLMRKAATVNEASVRMGPVSMVQESEKSVALLCTSDSGKMATLIVNRDNIEAIETGADSPPPTPLCSSLRR